MVALTNKTQKKKKKKIHFQWQLLDSAIEFKHIVALINQ